MGCVKLLLPAISEVYFGHKSRGLDIFFLSLRIFHYALTDKWILAQKLRIPKIQFAKYMKLKKENQNVDTLLLFRKGTKIPMEGVNRDKFWSRD